MTRGAQPGFHPGKTRCVTLDEREVGILGRIDPRIGESRTVCDRPAYLCIARHRLAAAVRNAALPRRPEVSLDVSRRRPRRRCRRHRARNRARDRCRCSAASAPALRVFDEYRGPQVGDGRKSLAARVTLQRFDATITDEEADAAVRGCSMRCANEFGAEIRT